MDSGLWLRIQRGSETMKCKLCGGKMEFRHYKTPTQNGDIISKVYACIKCHFATIVEVKDEGKGRQTHF